MGQRQEDDARGEHDRIGCLAPAEREQLAGKHGRPVRRLADGVEHLAAAVVLVRPAQEQVGVSGDDHQQVVEVVCHATSNLADRLDTLGFAHPRLHALALRHVHCEREDSLHVAVD